MADIKYKAQAELELRRRLNEKLSSFDNFLLAEKPEFDWELKYLIYMRTYLERIAAGEKIKVMFFLPPQHGKSTQNTIHFGAYYLLKNPKNNVILGAYNSDFASDFSIEIRQLVAKYKKLYVEKANRWKITGGGGLRSGGVGSGITGFPADLIIIDDPIKTAEDAYSVTYRNRMWNWWSTVITSRMHVNTSCIFTMTRWHMDDLAARIMEREEGWIVVSIPAISQEDDLLERKPNEALWIEKFPLDFLLEKQKADPGSFESLYQQNPVAAEGSIIKRSEIHYYDHDPGRYDYILQSWDTAFKDGERNDYSALTTWGCIANKIYLIDAYRAKLEYPELKTLFMQYAAKWKPNLIVVEDKASGQSLVQDLKCISPYPLRAILPNGDKTVRCHIITDKIRAGLILFPKEKEWTIDYINELCSFPAGKNDDWVDSTTQALIYLSNKYNAPLNTQALKQLNNPIRFMG